jgi:hypothetical protein
MGECPPWVKSRHWSTSNQCPLAQEEESGGAVREEDRLVRLGDLLEHWEQ